MWAQCNIPEHKLQEERGEDICKHRKKKWIRTFEDGKYTVYSEKKNGGKEDRGTERGKDRSLCCIIWQGTSLVLSDGGVRMIGLTHTRTHTHTHSLSLFPFLCLPPSPLVAFQSRDQPLADRTGPLGSCYRPPQRRDWKALIAALRSPQSRENHSVSVIGSLTWDGGKREGRREQTERGEWKAGYTPSDG